MKKLIENILYFLVIGFLSFYVIVTFFFPDNAIDVLGFRSFIILTGSMEPDINQGDLIFITAPHEDELEVRDAITFRVYIDRVGEETFVTHYIGEITEDEFGNTIYKTQGATKEEGDYDDWEDEEGNPVEIMFDDIEGVYLFRIPWVGKFITALQDPIFLGLLAVNGTILYVLYRYLKPKKS